MTVTASPSLSTPIAVNVSHHPPTPSLSYQYALYPLFPPSYSLEQAHDPCGDPTMDGRNPFRVGFVTRNISVCHDCKGRYYKDAGPPHDLCLQHQEWRTFMPQGYAAPQYRYGNVYYHCCISCVVAVWPSFIPSSVIVPHDMMPCLQPEHKEWLHIRGVGSITDLVRPDTPLYLPQS